MSYELREYSFGETIGKGFNLYFNNFLPLVLVALLCQLPVLLFMQSTHMLNPVGYSTRNILANFGIIFIMSIIVQAFLSGFIIYLVSKKFLEDSSLPENPKSASLLPMIIPIVGLSFAIGFLTLLGMIALLVPGIIVALGYSIATNILVVERKTIGEAMKRSWELTRGYKGEIFGLILVIAIIVACIQQPVLYALNAVLHLDIEMTNYLKQIVAALFEPIQACILVVVYFNLRIRKEGFNIEHLTQQFSLIDGQGPSVEG